MKKALSLLLAVLMLVSAVTFVASAAKYREPVGVCNCLDHIETKYCNCCLDCKNLDTSYMNGVNCCKKSDDGKYWEKCCSICNGLKDCECTDCSCCAKKSDEQMNEGSTSILPPSVQSSLVEGFQNAMNKIRKVFDDFFDAIFEFLKIEDFFG